MWAACNRVGETPLEQAPIETLERPLAGELSKIYLTVNEYPVYNEALLRVAGEFARQRLTVAVVWQMRQAPTTKMLASFPGKVFRQFYDPDGKMRGTGGRLSVNGELVNLEEVALRVRIARALLADQITRGE
jgi:hypothetical protein